MTMNFGGELKKYDAKEIKVKRVQTSQRSQGDGEETTATSLNQLKSKSVDDTDGRTSDLKFIEFPSFSKKDISKNAPSRSQLPQVSNIAQKLSKISIMNAPDPLVLSSPPVDLDKKVKIFLKPTEGYLPERRFNTPVVRRKEPKFIPYEPYKACVKPILGQKHKRSKVKYPLAIKSKPKLGKTDASAPTKKGIRNSTDKEKFHSIIADFEKEKNKWEVENSALKAENQELENSLADSKREINQLQNQLSTQSQVNNELKKLLVASVGEDVQGRVQCLTEDKARMATMIRKYSEKVDKDYEEKERMAIQCDVWRSKFLASSLLIDELARWKGTLFKHYQDAQDVLRVLLQEREIIHHSLVACYKHLHQTRQAFDPLRAECGGMGLLDSSDVVSLSVSAAAMGENLRDRLLGTLGREVGNTDLVLPQETRTPGEKMAIQVLDNSIDPSGTVLGLPSSPSKSSLISRYHPNSRTENLTLNCCAHCSGDIKVV